MSPSSPLPGTHELKLPLDPDAEVTVFDGRDDIRYAGTGADAVRLERGLYTVRVDAPSGVVEQTVRLDRDRDLTALAPPRRTATPVLGAATTHEYYSLPAGDLSRTATRRPIGESPDAALLVFLRTLDVSRAAELDPGTLGLLLRDGEGRTVSAFSPEELQVRPEGSVGLSAPARSGFYRLALADGSRELALHLYPGYQTQVFVPFEQGVALDRARVLLRETSAGFSRDDEVARAVEASLDALADGRGRLPVEAMRLLAAPSPNPMLCFVAAHVVAQRFARAGEPPSSGRHRDALSKAVETLVARLPDAPDTAAVQIAAAFATRAPLPDVEPPRTPPMLRSGMEAVVRFAATRANVPAQRTLLDDVSTVLFPDSIFTTWRSLARPAVQWRETSRTWKPTRLRETLLTTVFGPQGAELNWIQLAFLTELGRRWRGRGADATRTSAEKPLEVPLQDLAHRLGTTPVVIREAVAALDRRALRRALRDALEKEWPEVVPLLEAGSSALSRYLVASPAGPETGGAVGPAVHDAADAAAIRRIENLAALGVRKLKEVLEAGRAKQKKDGDE